MNRAFEVFVSYSSANEGRVGDYVELLRKRGISLWYAKDERAIPGGKDYAEIIPDVIEGCKVLLVMLTEAASSSEHVHREIQLAMDARIEIVPLLLDGRVEVSGKTKYRLAGKQDIDATKHGWLERLVETFLLYGVSVSDPSERIAASPRSPSRKAPVYDRQILPYLADREQQEHYINQLVAEHARSDHAARPIFVVIHGPQTQACEGFANRLQSSSLPTILARTKGSNQLECKSVAWPEQDRAGSPGGLGRLEAYKRSVLDRLEALFDADPDAVVRRIGTLRRPVLFSSLIGADVWTENEADFIASVASFWASLPDIPTPSQPLIVLVSVSYVQPSLPVFAKWFGSRALPSPAAQLAKLHAPLDPAMTLAVLPQLTSVTLSEVEGWVSDWLQPSEKDNVLMVVHALFKRSRKEAEALLSAYLDPSEGIDAFVSEALKSIFEERGRHRALPMRSLAPVLRSFVPREEQPFRKF